MQFDVLTLFPGIFSGFLSESLLEKAIKKQLVDVHIHDFREWADNRHQSVDDRPYGGGPGMVLTPQPIVECAESIGAGVEERKTSVEADQKRAHRLVLLTPTGRRWNQAAAEEFVMGPNIAARAARVTLICGRYEGFDQRVIKLLEPEEWSLGDFVLNGGEVAAMAIIESLIRLIPGVLGDKESSIDDSFSSGNRLLEAPQYTRPRDFRGLTVPEVLLSGDHQAIARWRAEQSLERTKQRRGDLLPGEPSSDDKSSGGAKPQADIPSQSD
jgi:tRNA (guanine37-N1)-methyltransferase